MDDSDSDPEPPGNTFSSLLEELKQAIWQKRPVLFDIISKHVTLGEMINPMLPEIYRVLYSSPQRDPRFEKLTPEQLFHPL